tara:strand:- start:2363 stop:2926 length:564 start_codon:yes stop_codon:yes gene_type:complete
MADKMKNIKDNIKDKVLSYYRDIKDRQIELENRYYNYVKNRSHNQIKQVDLIVTFFLGMILICFINLFFENVWKTNDNWTRLENLSLFYIYYRVSHHICDNMTEYLFDIRSKKKKEEKKNKPGATKENPIDLTKNTDKPEKEEEEPEKEEEESEKEEEEPEKEEKEPEKEIVNKLNEDEEVVYEIEI